MKRRIVAFIILAVAATSSGLIFRAGEPRPFSDNVTSIRGNEGVFYEALPSRQTTPIGGQAAQLAVKRTNLTQSFAETVTSEWINKNPLGPELIENQQWLNVPHPEDIVQNYLEKEIRKFNPEDFVPIINDSDIKITYEKNSAVFETYAESLQKIENVIQKTNINRDFAIDDAKKIEKASEAIIGILQTTEVPNVLINLHREQLRFVIFQKNLLGAMANYEQDPVQAILISRNVDFYSKLLDENFKKLEQEIEKLNTISFNDYSDDKKSLIVQLHLIKRAYAASPVPVFEVNTPGFIATTIASWAKDALRWAADKGWTISVEALKKRLLDMIVDQIVRWVQGGGEPKFITDWGGFMGDAFNIAFDEVTKQLGLGFVCSPFNLQVRLLLNRPPTFSQQITCRLDQVVGNINSFYGNFLNGGWVAYQELWQPQGNAFGLTLIGYDELMRRNTEERDAKRSEGIANQGFLSVKRCVAYDEDVTGNINCSQYETVTPGRAVGDATAQTIGAGIAWLVNARDLSAYIAAIGDAFINRLIREGVAGLSNVSTPSAPTGGYIPQGLSGSCAGLAGVALSACLDVTESTQNVQTQVDAKACETLEGNKFNECVIGFLTVVMTAPADNSIISGTSTISAAAGYAKGIERVEFYVNNILVATDFTAPYSINIDTESLSDGQYIIIARAFGLDGNSKQSDSITITVDNVVEQDFSGY